MQLERRYEVWRARHGAGWGLSWFLSAATAERFGPRCGVTLVPQHREGLGWYGLLVQVVGRDGHWNTLGRITAHGDVERWGGSQPDRIVVNGDPAASTAAAVEHLGLDRLPCRADARASDAAITIRILARVALQVGTGAFATLPDPEGVSAPGLPRRLVLYGPSAEITIRTERAAHEDGFDLVGRYLRGESEEAIAADLLKRLGLVEPLSPGKDTEGGYNLAVHRHRYAAWCAARAAGRKLGGATNQAVRVALESSGLPAVVAGPVAHWPSSAPEFDRVHRRWCAQIVSSLHAQGVDGATFGRAAKIAAVYLKTLIVCGGHSLEPLADVAHPPIDRVLLQALARERRFPSVHRNRWRNTSWTELDVDGYDEVICSLRDVGLDFGGFWRIERWWTGDAG